MNSLKHKEQRVLVLFDIQNLYYSTKHLYNTKVDFKAILNEAVDGRRLVRAVGYAINTEIKEESIFHDALNNIGIEVKTKDLQVFQGGAKKGDWDIGIAMDAVRMAEKIDCLVLVSGDGDFKDLLEYMKAHGCRTEVIALGRTSSKHLREAADSFFDLESNLNKFLIGKFKQPQKGKQQKRTGNKPQYKKPVNNIQVSDEKKTQNDSKPSVKPNAKQNPRVNKSNNNRFQRPSQKEQLNSLANSMRRNSNLQDNAQKSLDEPDFDIYDDMDDEPSEKKDITKKETKSAPKTTAKKATKKSSKKTTKKKTQKKDDKSDSSAKDKTDDKAKEKKGLGAKLKKLINKE